MEMRRRRFNVKIKDLISLIFDDVIIYKQVNDGEYEDVYKGNRNTIPPYLLEMDVRIIGAAKKGVVDIQVKIDS